MFLRDPVRRTGPSGTIAGSTGVKVEERARDSAGVTGNARLTGSAGAVILVLLAVEGITILRVQRLISAHVFVGVLLVPIVLVKVATTTYRAARYYRGDADYTGKGPPPMILRVLGPLVVVLTLAVLGTGLAAIAEGPRVRWVVTAHKASFILWFGVMTVHVLGHILETPALAVADWRSRRRRGVPGAPLRIGVLLGALAIGAAVAVASLGWIGAWRR
jgi:hypothetical protein